MPNDATPTALTEEEKRFISQLEHAGVSYQRAIAIIRRLDEEVLAMSKWFMREQLDHTETFKEKERAEAERDALRAVARTAQEYAVCCTTFKRDALKAALAALDRAVPGWREG